MLICLLVLFFSSPIFTLEQIWLVQFPSTNPNYIEKLDEFTPWIDIIQRHQSTYIFSISNEIQSDFSRFIHQFQAHYRIFDRQSFQTNKQRSKRWTPSNDPLDDTYLQHYLSYEEQEQWYQLLRNSSSTKNVIRLHHIGRTYENRSLTVIQIHSSGEHLRRGKRRRRYAVFIDGGMHAREWLSIGVANYLLSHFLRLRKTDAKVQKNFTLFRSFLFTIDESRWL